MSIDIAHLLRTTFDGTGRCAVDLNLYTGRIVSIANSFCCSKAQSSITRATFPIYADEIQTCEVRKRHHRLHDPP